ncbi:MAG: PAS domain S-box protein [Planctomycetota bacterium]
MKEKIKILVLEDSVADAELVEHTLRKEGIDFISKRVETRENFVKELKDFEPDIILSDYSLPAFDGMEALTIVKKRHLEIPFIIVTGSLGEELTVKLLKEGMTDYILKDKLARLGPAVRRALIEVKEQTEYKKTEELLRTSEKKYRELVANSLVGVYQCNLQGDVLFANEALAQLLGCGASEELIGTNALPFYKNPERRVEFVDELKKTGMVSNFEVELVSRTGLAKHVFLSATFDGRIISGMMLDITERKKMEEALKQSEEQWHSLVENAPGIIIIVDEKGIIQFINRTVSGYTIQNTIGRSMYDYIEPSQHPVVMQCIKQVFRTGQADNYCIKGGGSDGQYAWYETQVGPIKYNGQVKAVVLISIDITARIQAENALKESEEKFRAIFDNASDGLLIADIGTHKFYLSNDAISKMLGYSIEEIKNLTITDIHPSESLSYVMEQFEKQGRGEITLAKDIPVKRKDGSVFYADVNSSQVTVANKLCLLGVFRDITERKKIDESLRVSEQQWRSTFDTISDIICILDISGKTLRCNKAIANIIQKPYNEIVGRPCWENFHGTSGRIKECPFERMRQTLRREITIAQIDNKWYEITVDPLRDDAGNLIGAVHIMSDITERKKLEEQLFRSQKMEAIGTLAGGVAHDFNNILTVIQGYTEMALMDMAKNDPLFNHMENILQASQRAADLIRQLLIFGRKHHIKFSDLDINRTIIDLLKMLTRLIGENITITTDLASDSWGIKADNSNIEQVIMNLVVNARDAMPKGGEVTIQTENVVIDEDYCRTNTEATPGQFVRLSITDNGIGMDKETMKRLFEPFFSTKEIGKGGGLGLSVVYGIVKQHQGWINVYSELAHGTIFTIYLPAVTGQIEKKAEKRITTDTPEGNGERILLVEDEAPVRELGITVLEKHNYVVFAAATAQEAKQLYEREKGRFHLIFSDTILPDSNGLELVNQLRVYNPELPVLMCSGYSNEKIHKAILQEKQVPFLQKPYSVVDMLRVVKETIKSK